MLKLISALLLALCSLGLAGAAKAPKAHAFTGLYLGQYQQESQGGDEIGGGTIRLDIVGSGAFTCTLQSRDAQTIVVKGKLPAVKASNPQVFAKASGTNTTTRAKVSFRAFGVVSGPGNFGGAAAGKIGKSTFNIVYNNLVKQ